MQSKFGHWCLILALACLTACSGGNSEKSDNTGHNLAALSNKERQYFSNGQQLYEQICQSCHMDKGQGLAALIPPLKGSDYLMKNVPMAARIIKFGLDGPIAVNGKEFNQPMPANPQLTNLEIAEILTFISNSWGNAHGGIGLEEVENALKETD